MARIALSYCNKFSSRPLNESLNSGEIDTFLAKVGHFFIPSIPKESSFLGSSMLCLGSFFGPSLASAVFRPVLRDLFLFPFPIRTEPFELCFFHQFFLTSKYFFLSIRRHLTGRFHFRSITAFFQ